MAMDLVIIHSKDTTQWKDYICSYLGKEVFNKKILDKRDVDLLEHDPAIQSEISRAKALIVIASPLHLLFLIEFSGFSYARFVADVGRAQLFLCGVDIADFAGVDTNGASIAGRFPNFRDWKKLSHDRHSDLLRNAMVLMEAEGEEDGGSSSQRTTKPSGKHGTKRRRKKEFQITPVHVKCKEKTTVTILFNDSMTEQDERIPLLVDFRVSGKAIKINATWRNPYVYQFNAPDLPSGKHSFTVTAKGSEVGSNQLIYDPNEGSRSTSAELVEVYVDQMARLCRYICNTGLMTAEVDNILAEIFDETASSAIPLRVFEEFFGTNVIHRSGSNSAFEFPTLLHLAANFGFSEFATRLIDLPDAQSACVVRNAAGKIPETMAKDNSYDDLASLFQDYRLINETIHNAYEVFHPEPGIGNFPSDSSEASRTPRAILSSSGSEDSYMIMKGLGAGKKEDDSDSETGYVDMDNELQELYSRKEHKSAQRYPQSADPRMKRPLDDQRRANPQPSSLLFTATTASGECRSTGDSGLLSNLDGVSESQKKLMDIKSSVKQGKMTTSEAEHLTNSMKFCIGTGRTKSFKEKQHQMSSLREQLSKSGDSTAQGSPSCVPVIGRRIATVTSPASVPHELDRPNTLSSSSSSSSTSSSSSSAATIRQYSSSSAIACSPGATELEANEKQNCKNSSKQDPPPQATFPFLDHLNENSQRQSTISGSSRESWLSIASRASTSSGVDIDVADDENQSDSESRSVNNRRGNDGQGGGGGGGNIRRQSSKRKSNNLERLEEELTGAEALLPPPIPPRTTLPMQQSSPTSSPSTLSPPAPTSIALPPLPGRREMARKRSRSEGYVLSMVPAEKGGKDPELTTAGRHLLLESLDSDHRSEQSYTQVAKNSSDRMNAIGEEESKVIRKPSGFPIGRPQSVDIQEVTAGKEGSSDSKLRASRETKGSTDNRVQPLNLQTASRLTVDSNETSKSRAQRQQQQVKTAEESCCGRRLAPMDAKAVCHAIDKGHSHQSILTPPGATADRQPVECSRHESRVSFKIPAEPVQQSKQLSGQDLCQDLKASKSSSSNQRSFKGIITGKQEAEEEATSDPRTQRRKQSKSFAEYNMGLPAAPEKVDKPPIVLQTSDTKTEAAVVATTYRRSTSHGTLHGAEEKPSDHSRTPVPCLSTRARISPADQRDARKDQQQVVASSSSSADSAAATPSDIAQGGINLETTRTGGKLGTRSSPKAKWPPPPQTPKKPPKKTNDGD